MSTLLELVQATCREGGISGWATITDVTMLQGQQQQALNWVQGAWMAIQRMSDVWAFMRKQLSFLTVQGQYNYSGGYAYSIAPLTPNVLANSPLVVNGAAGALHKLVDGSFRIYDNVSGIGTETRLNHTTWDAFRELFRFSNVQLQQNRPYFISITPEKDIVLALQPDNGQGSGYTVYGDYVVRPTLMTVANSTVPWMPPEYHELITWYGVWRYGGFQEATAQYVNAMNQAKPILQALRNDQLPRAQAAAPLVG